MATALTSQLTRFTDRCNRVLSSGIIKTFEPNSLTPKITYQDSACTIPNLLEVNLDETGRAKIFISGDCRVQVYSHDGVLIEDFLFVEQVNEFVFTTTNPSLNINNGTIQVLTLNANGTLSASLQTGQSMTLLIDLNSFNLTVAFKKTQDFTLTNGGKNLCVLFKIGDDVYITSGGAFP